MNAALRAKYGVFEALVKKEDALSEIEEKDAYSEIKKNIDRYD